MITAFKNMSVTAANRIGINDSPCLTVGRTRNYGPKLQYKRDLGFMFRYPGGVAPEEAAGESLEGQVR